MSLGGSMSKKKYTLAQLRGAWAAGKNDNTNEHPLVGKYFLSFVGGLLNWQGHIVAMPVKDQLLIQLFSHVDGEPTDQRFINIDEMMDWRFYDDDDLWRRECRNEYLKNRERNSRSNN
jgi:hypothetical protein